MGQQYNKVEKRRRHQRYLDRLKAKAKAGGTSKLKAKKPAKKKAAA